MLESRHTTRNLIQLKIQQYRCVLQYRFPLKAKNNKDVKYTVNIVGEVQNAYTIMIWKPKGKRYSGSSKHTWEDNIKMDFKK